MMHLKLLKFTFLLVDKAYYDMAGVVNYCE